MFAAAGRCSLAYAALLGARVDINTSRFSLDFGRHRASAFPQEETRLSLLPRGRVAVLSEGDKDENSVRDKFNARQRTRD